MEFGYRTAKADVISERYDTDAKESEMVTGDLNIVDVEWTIQYQIIDAKAWLFNFKVTRYRDDRLETIKDISRSVISGLVGDRNIFDVLGPERENIQIKAQDIMNNKFKEYKLGINIIGVKLQNIRAPEGEVWDAFQDVTNAIQDMERLINEGKEAYNKEIPRASGQAKKMIQEAQGYSNEKVNEAEGDVARYKAVLAEYQKNPDITRNRLYIEMMEDVFGELENTDLIDKNLDNFLPLKNLQGNGGVQ